MRFIRKIIHYRSVVTRFKFTRKVPKRGAVKMTVVNNWTSLELQPAKMSKNLTHNEQFSRLRYYIYCGRNGWPSMTLAKAEVGFWLELSWLWLKLDNIMICYIFSWWCHRIKMAFWTLHRSRRWLCKMFVWNFFIIIFQEDHASPQMKVLTELKQVKVQELICLYWAMLQPVIIVWTCVMRQIKILLKCVIVELE